MSPLSPTWSLHPRELTHFNCQFIRDTFWQDFFFILSILFVEKFPAWHTNYGNGNSLILQYFLCFKASSTSEPVAIRMPSEESLLPFDIIYAPRSTPSLLAFSSTGHIMSTKYNCSRSIFWFPGY